MKRKTIAILLHKDDASFIYFRYLIKLLIKEWRTRGFAVEMIRGTDRFVPADLIIPHLDLTCVPDEYREFLAQYPAVINGNVRDISKSTISRNLVGRDHSYAGPVIVKTDLNSGGLPETRLVGQRHLLRALTARLTRKGRSSMLFRRPNAVSWADVRQLYSGDYPVFSSLQEVPPEIFDNKHLVIEKFLPEVTDGSYHVRYCTFLGDRDTSEMYQSRQPVVKASNSTHHQAVPTPPELHEIRKQLGLDYGKVDYVIRDGSVVLLDVNPTPGLPEHSLMAQHLADGIFSKLNR